MNISKLFIDRPVATSLVMISLLAFGTFSLFKLPVSVLPETAPNTISVTCNYPGASPKQVADLVTSPLETQFMATQGVENITSTSSYGSSSILIQFHPTTNINDAATNTQQAISQAQGQLPPLPSLPSYQKVNPSDTPVMYIVLYSSTQTQGMIYDYANNFIARQLGTIEGVAQVQVYGNAYAVRIHVDPQSIAAKGITMSDVANAINQNNPVVPTGKFYGPNFTIVTQADGQMLKAQDYNSMIIKINNDNVVRLSDIGYAYDSISNDQQTIKWIVPGDDQPNEAVFLAIYKQNMFNTITVCSLLEEKMEQLIEDLPQSLKYSIPFSEKDYVVESIEDIEMTLYIAFALVVIVVFLYLGKLRNSIIPLITLPITITGTFIFMFPLGYNLDVMSLSAITLATGFLVDDAIIVLENIVRHVEEGESPYQGAVKGSKQILTAIISISICLCVVFIPMLFIPGVVGQLFSELAGVMIIAILFSGFISISFTPMLCSRFIPPYNPNEKSKVEEMSIAFNEKLRKIYEPGLNWALNHKKSTLLLALGVLISSLVIAYHEPKEFLPDTPINAIAGYVIAENGASPEKTNRYLKEIGKITMQNPWVTGVCVVSDSPTDNMGILFVILDGTKGNPPFRQILNEFYQKSASVIGCHAFFKPLPLINVQTGSSTSGRANYQYVVTAKDQKIVEEKAQQLMSALQAQPEFTQVNSDLAIGSPTLDFHILRDQARAYGNITPLNVENTLSYSYGQTYVSTMYNPNSVNYVILELKNRFKKGPDMIDALYLGPQTANTNMTSVSKNTLTATTSLINHFNSMPSATISFNTAPNFTISEALAKIDAIAPAIFGGEAFGFTAGASSAFQKAMAQLAVLVGLALFAIYIVLGILYENFLHPITPLSAVPMAAFGGLITLAALGVSLSIYAMIGIIMLMGIVMKNGILIVDFALEEIEKDPNCTADEAIRKASMIRFRPILMTTLAAMMGAVPVALGIGGEIALGRAPLGIAIVGGLIFAQIISLIVGPVVFTYVYNWSKKLTGKKDGLFSNHEQNPQ